MMLTLTLIKDVTDIARSIATVIAILMSRFTKAKMSDTRKIPKSSAAQEQEILEGAEKRPSEPMSVANFKWQGDPPLPSPPNNKEENGSERKNEEKRK